MSPIVWPYKNSNEISQRADQPNYTHWFYCLILLHLVLWTLMPTLLRHTLPMDALEGFVWGQTWQLGYDRNPWLNAWLTHVAVLLGGGGRSGWIVYFLSQLSVVACFFAIWRLGKKILSPLYALVAVFMLEAIQYYSLAAIDFNDNVLELGLWAFLILNFYNALTLQKNSDWLWVGFFAALSLMDKYYAVVLFFPMFLLLLFTREGRVSFGKKGLYLGAVLFLLIVMPHFIWLLNHNFETVNYALMRVAHAKEWQKSWWYFAALHGLAFVGPLILFSILWFGNKSKDILCEADKHELTNFTQTFLVVLALGPYLVTVLLSALFKISLHVLWGTPLLSLWGLLLVALIQPQITKTRFYFFVASVLATFFGIMLVYSYSIIYLGYASSATYPGKAVAEYITEEWAKHYHSGVDLRARQPFGKYAGYVIGDRYTAGNVAYFAKYKIKACIWDEQLYYCDRDAKVRQDGAVFVWRANEKNIEQANAKFIAQVKQRFPQVIWLPLHDFQWVYHADKPSLSIGIGILLPNKKLTS